MGGRDGAPYSYSCADMCQHFVDKICMLATSRPPSMQRHPDCRSRAVRGVCFLLQRSLRRGALSALSCVGARRSTQHAGTPPSRHTPLGATEHDDDDGRCCPALALMVHAAAPPDARLPLDGSLLNSWACAGLALGQIHVIATPPLLPPARASGPRSLRPLCFALCIKKHPPVQHLTPSPIR
jgi:hypothetical protein